MDIAGDKKARRHFEGLSRHWRSTIPGPSIQLIYVPVSNHPRDSECCASILSGVERARIARIKDAPQKAEFAQRRGFRRYCAAIATGSDQPLSAIEFTETDKGRPRLSGTQSICFSFSSCRSGMLGAWSEAFAIGVDIEDRTQDLEAAAVAEHFFTPTEAGAVAAFEGPARTRTFYRLWTLKEAALKSIGEGMPFGLDAFELALESDPRFVNAPSEYGGPGEFCAEEFEVGPMSAALVARRLTLCGSPEWLPFAVRERAQ